MESLPTEILKLVLCNFQDNEESYLLGLVCKKWNSIISRKKDMQYKSVIVYYTEIGSLSALQWLQ